MPAIPIKKIMIQKKVELFSISLKMFVVIAVVDTDIS